MNRALASKGFIFFLVLGLPLILSDLTLDRGLHIRFIVLSSATLLLSLVLVRKWIHQNEAKPLTTSILTVYGLYVLYMLLRISGKYVLADSIFDWLKIVIPFILLVLIYQLYAFRILRDSIVWSISLLGVLLTSWGIVELVGLAKMGDLAIPNSTYNIMACFEHRNLLAQVLLLSLPFQFLQTIGLKNKYIKIAFLFTATLSFFLLIVLFNRAVWLATMAAFCVPVLFFLILKLKSNKVEFTLLPSYLFRVLISLIVAGFFAFFFIQSYTDRDAVKTHTEGIVSLETGTGKDRLELWKRTWDMFSESPVIGKGLGNWKIEVLKYGHEGLTSEDNATFYQRPHNDFLWILSETGLIGFGLYLLIIILVIIKIYQFIRGGIQQKDRLFFIAVLISLSAYLVYSLFSFPRERIVQNTIITLLISTVLVFDFEQGKKELLPIKKTFIFLISADLLLVCVFSIGFGVLRFNGEMHTKEALAAKTERNYEMIIQHIDQAENPAWQMDPVSTPLSWYTGFAYYQMKNPQLAKQHFQKALTQNPYHIHILNNLASSFALLKEYDSAIFYYEKAVIIAPNFDESWFNMAAIYYNNKEYFDAYESLKKVNLFSKDERYRPFVKTILKSLIREETIGIDTLESIQLPENEDWYFDLHKQLRNENRILKNLIFEDHILSPNK